MTSTCKYCNEPEDKQNHPGLICDTCICFVHLKCLKRQGTPGDFSGDVFFDFTCADCSPSKSEEFSRSKFQWVNVLLLTLHHLSITMQGISNNGFFHYKTQICSFIDRYWTQLFGPRFKQKKNWVGTISGALSVYNSLIFQSGSLTLGESGWWKLMHQFSPAVAAHIIQEMARDKTKGRPRNQIALDWQYFIEKVTELGYSDYLCTEPQIKKCVTEPQSRKRRLYSDKLGEMPSSSAHDHFEDEMRDKEYLEEALESSLTCVTAKDNDADVESMFHGMYFAPSTNVAQSETSSVYSSHALHYDSDSHSSYHHTDIPSDEEKFQRDRDAKKVNQKPKKVEEKIVYSRESLFSTELNSEGMPWIEEPVKEENKNLVEMSEYEEVQLLKNVENLIPKVKDPNKKAHLQRFKAKLALRRLKRHNHLPIFNLDKTVKLLGGYVTEDPRTVMNAERTLDRFQRSYLIDNLCGTIASSNYGTLLLSHIEPTPFRSSYSGAILKPFIRRDYTSTPTWLKVTAELMQKTRHRAGASMAPSVRASLDYSYVRPQHIAAVNTLCAQFFWPGIDLTEALQYPEFSCVVTYKRLVVACAFLVPDVGHSEAYISFVLVRPEWRRAGIATFMLYHLLQTCTDKDVTLHVSPTNPAIFLYQKFGFKVEELIQDFYEKYFDIDYKGCRHAVFLRLVR